jgi:hypothetical protein
MSETKRFRVLWIDAAGEGRFTTVDATGPAPAAWKVAQLADSSSASFEAIQQAEDDDR